MRRKFLRGASLAAIVAGAMMAFGHVAWAQTQTQQNLWPAKPQFFDNNGAPLASGTASFYVPNTLTPKTTYQDPFGSVSNPTSVPLDSAGRAFVYGNGLYRMILQDSASNTIYDGLTGAPLASQSISSTGTAFVGGIACWNNTQATQLKDCGGTLVDAYSARLVFGTYTPVYDIGGTLSANVWWTPPSSTTIPSADTYTTLLVSNTNGAEPSFSIGVNAQASMMVARPHALSSSSASSSLYALDVKANNEGPGKAHGIHTGCFGVSGSTGPCVGINSEIKPVVGQGITTGLQVSLTSSGANSVAATGVGVDSNTDQFGTAICGGCISNVNVNDSFLRWVEGTSLGANARFAKLQNSSFTEIAYWDKNGNILAPAHYGGATSSSSLTLQSTTQTGGGQTDFIAFLTGNTSPSVEKMRLDTNGNLGLGTTSPFTTLTVNGGAAFKTPVYVMTLSYTVLSTDFSIIDDQAAGNLVLTLPSAASNNGRMLMVKNYSNVTTVVSASSNVTALAGPAGVPGTAILAAGAGKWAILQSDGGTWVVMAAN